jgi:hypothetical protein
MQKLIGVDELRGLLPSINDSISDSAVGFVKLIPNTSPQDATIAGSGTLVSSGRRHAILTADHVLDVLPNRGEIGLVLPSRRGPQLHRATLDMSIARKRTIGRASYDENGPDIGLVLLAPADVSWLSSMKTFYNLDKRRESMLAAPRPIELGGWFLSGMIGESTSELSPEHGFARVKAFRGFTGAGVVAAERRREGFDYLEFQAKYDAAYEGPRSFEGVSGGGLWQAVFEEREGAICVSKVLLSGVAFFQSSIQNDVRTISCHGRQSIYDVVVGKFESA